MDLYFCKGWHRKGGESAIRSAESLKVLQMCFSMAPGTNGPLSTPHPSEAGRMTIPPNNTSRYAIRHREIHCAPAPENQTVSRPSPDSASVVINSSSKFVGQKSTGRPSRSISQAVPNYIENSAAVSSRLYSIKQIQAPWNHLNRLNLFPLITLIRHLICHNFAEALASGD